MDLEKIKAEALKRFSESKEVSSKIEAEMQILKNSVNEEASKVFGVNVKKDGLMAYAFCGEFVSAVVYKIHVVRDFNAQVTFDTNGTPFAYDLNVASNPYDGYVYRRQEMLPLSGEQLRFFYENVNLNDFKEVSLGAMDPRGMDSDKAVERLNDFRKESLIFLDKIPETNKTKNEIKDFKDVLEQDDKWANFVKVKLNEWDSSLKEEEAKRNKEKLDNAGIVERLRARFFSDESKELSNKI